MLAAAPFLRAFAQWRLWQLDSLSPPRVQERELLDIVRRAKSTRFGRDHEFAGIRSVAEYQERVPLRRYDDFWEDYWKDAFPRLEDCTWPGTIPYFALTSGTTTGITKHIPCSRDMLSANSRAAQDLLVHHLVNRPTSLIFGGKSFMIGGSTDLREEAPGIYSGDLSGIQANEVPWWGRPYVFPPRELALLADWEDKIDQMAPLSLKEDIRAISGTPSWLLVLFDRLAELHSDDEPRLVNYYPDLELVIHGGIDFKPYARRFAQLLEGSRAELREVYAASEAFVALADRGQGEGLRLLFDNGVFYEFVPTAELNASAPTRHWLGTVEPGIEYAIVLSTCAGAWAYILGDTIRFVDLDPPRIVVTGRTSYVLSAFGEHLIDEEIAEAVAVAADAIGAKVREYCVTAVVPERTGGKGEHRYVVEFIGARPNATALSVFCDELDNRLRTLNADYAVHRKGDYGLGLPVVDVVDTGTFDAWLKSRGQYGGQHKVPRVMNSPELVANLKAFVSVRKAQQN